MIARSDVTIVATALSGWSGDVWHIRVGSADYVVSAATSPWGGGSETAVFPATPDGEATSRRDVVVHAGYDHEAAISDLIRHLNSRD
ncbi:hypothetical protein [Amycolatopsis sp. NPDC004079]|uniref:hypothetical protein n=1 Tax=Amycolatopsis sp. NPDC004079 TaxID=3154549 RepID=UPI0033BDBB23